MLRLPMMGSKYLTQVTNQVKPFRRIGVWDIFAVSAEFAFTGWKRNLIEKTGTTVLA